MIEVQNGGEYIIQVKWRTPRNFNEIYRHNLYRIFAVPYRMITIEYTEALTETISSILITTKIGDFPTYSTNTLTESHYPIGMAGSIPFALINDCICCGAGYPLHLGVRVEEGA